MPEPSWRAIYIAQNDIEQVLKDVLARVRNIHTEHDDCTKKQVIEAIEDAIAVLNVRLDIATRSLKVE